MGQLSKLSCVIEVNKVEGPYDIAAKLLDDNEHDKGIYRKTYDKNPRNSIYFNINV